MTWVRIDDHFTDHPKILQVGPLGGWVQVCALTYCNRYLTDGFVSREAAQRLTNFEWIGLQTGECHEQATIEHAINSLLEVGIWEEVFKDDYCIGYLIHDFHDYQPSKESVLEERQKTAARVRKHRVSKKQSNGVTNGVGNGVSNGTPVPVPGKYLGLGSNEPRLVELNSEDQVIESIWNAYREKLGTPRMKLTAPRISKIRARLREGYDAGQLIGMLDGVLEDAKRWPERMNNIGIEVLYRSSDQVDKFLALAPNVQDEGTRYAEALALSLRLEREGVPT